MSKQNITYYGNTVKSPYVKIRKLCDYDYNCITVAQLTDMIYVETVAELVAAVAIGGRIKIAPGTYIISGSPLVPIVGTELIGSGIGNTIITSNVSIPLITLADNNITISNLTLGTSTYASRCISVPGTTQYITIDNVSFINTGISAKIRILAGTGNWIISNCIFNDTNGGVNTIESGTSLSTAILINNKFGVNPANAYASPTAQIQSSTFINQNINEPISLVYSTGDLNIINNNILGNIRVDPSSNNVTRNNVFLDNGDTGIASAFLPGNASTHEIIFDGNIIRETTNVNIDKSTTSAAATNVVIKNNIIYDTTLTNIAIAGNNDASIMNNMAFITDIDVADLAAFMIFNKNVNMTKSTPGASSIALNPLTILSLGHTITVTADGANSDDILLNNVSSEDGTYSGLNFNPGNNAVIYWGGDRWLWVDSGSATLTS